MKKIWNSWTKFTKRLALYSANVVLAIVYVLLIIPIGFILQTFFQKTLKGHGFTNQHNSFWSKKQKQPHNLFFAKEH